MSEWTKLISVRSTAWSLALLAVSTIGFTTLFTWLAVRQWDQTTPDGRARSMANPTATILDSGLYLGQIAVCVLGVLVISSEYSTGMIRSSLLAVPRRIGMLAAKGTVFAALVTVLGEMVAFPSFLIGEAIIAPHVKVSLSDPGVTRAVLGTGLYLGVLGLFALGLGAIIRHSAGAIAAVLGFVLVLSQLALLIPGSLGKHIYAYLPSNAGTQLMTTAQTPDQLLSPWQGFGVMCLWAALVLAVAGFLLARRDA
ncbi:MULTISPECIES: ABC transporter permease [unclassified Streptomyces]|uniref:ABC transporter permease n=1 Tax=unclassified Streptomyces TaxID=2593676 RepID=UPI003D91452D